MAIKKRKVNLPTPKETNMQPFVKLKSGWRLFRESLSLLWRHRKLYAAILSIYAFLSLLLVRGFGASSQVSQAKDSITAIKGISGVSAGGLGLFGGLLSSTGSSNSQSASIYQSVLLVVMSLVIIWTVRQTYDGKKNLTAKKSFYKSMYPLVPFLAILLVISLQLVPLLIGASLYGAVTSNSLAASSIEGIGWSLLFFAASVWSLYMVTPSVFALYVVTLPNATPRGALRTARGLVKKRRWLALRKILFLPLVLLLIFGVVLLPLGLWATTLAEWSFFILGILALPIVHSYLYGLYRDLLRE